MKFQDCSLFDSAWPAIVGRQPETERDPHVPDYSDNPNKWQLNVGKCCEVPRIYAQEDNHRFHQGLRGMPN